MNTTELPEIEYPTLYTFRAIGRSGPGLREHVLRLVQGVLSEVSDDSITERPSREGKYLAFQIRAFLRTEDERREVYRLLHQDERIVYFL